MLRSTRSEKTGGWRVLGRLTLSLPELLPIVQGVLAAHPVEAERYRSGKTGVLGFLVAQAMKQVAAAGAEASPKLVSRILTRELGSS